MADLAIAAVDATRAATRSLTHSGEALAVGKAVYHKRSDGKWYLATSATEEAAACRGVVVTPAAGADLPFEVATGGDLDVGVATADGTIYAVSDNPGGICPIADKGTGDHVTVIGVGKPGNVLGLHLWRTGVAIP
jgi:hypothetical protein